VIPKDEELARWLWVESNQTRGVLFPLFAKDDPEMIERILDLSPLFGYPEVNYSELKRLDRTQRRFQALVSTYFIALVLMILFLLRK